MKLPKHRYRLLCEALRRHTQINLQRGNKPLTEAWLGLGAFSTYKPALKAGFMTYVFGPHPGFITWWKLTGEGAKIVQSWLDQGFTHEDMEANNWPPHEVEV